MSTPKDEQPEVIGSLDDIFQFFIENDINVGEAVVASASVMADDPIHVRPEKVQLAKDFINKYKQTVDRGLPTEKQTSFNVAAMIMFQDLHIVYVPGYADNPEEVSQHEFLNSLN